MTWLSIVRMIEAEWISFQCENKIVRHVSLFIWNLVY